jgi:hypothetical protein
MSKRRQFPSQCGKIVDLAIENDDDVSVAAEHGLSTAGGIDHAESAVPQVNRLMLKVALVIWPSMADGLAHSS